MAVTVSTLRTRLATAAATVSGFTEGKQPYTAFLRDPATVAHKRFAVGAISSSPIQERQRATDGTPVRSVFRIASYISPRPKDQILDYGLARDAEHAIIKACMAQTVALLTNTQIVFSGTPRREVDTAGEWYLGEAEFVCLHTLALA